MTRRLEVSAAPTTTLQDGGRVGHARLGVPRSGPMDATAHRLACALAGSGQVALEVGPGGATLRAPDAALDLAIVAPDALVTTPGSPAESVAASVRRLAPGQQLRVEPGPHAQWVYVAVVGGLRASSVLGSVSQHPRSGIGPPRVDPWSLQVGEEPGRGPALGDRVWRRSDASSLGVLPAPQSHLFDAEVLELLVHATFTTTGRFDRMGHRLDGPTLLARGGHDIVSDGVVAGSLQIPGDGMPFVLTADHQTTGGYPKIAVLARADLDRFVQRPAGSEVRFEWIDGDEARLRLRAANEEVERVAATTPRPSGSTLAGANLITGVTEG